MQDGWGALLGVFRTLFGEFVGITGRLSPLFLLLTVLIAFVLYLRLHREERSGFFSWLVPKAIYLHRSHMVDVKIYLFGRVLSSFRIVGRIGITATIGAGTTAVLSDFFGTSGELVDPSFWQMALLTLLFALVADFCTYWVHRLHHENPVLWPFHSVHHSAEVLTPLTLYRKHPVYDFIGSMAKGCLYGLTTGVVVYAFFGKTSVLVYGGANLVYFAFNAVGSNLRHSHIWMSYGPVLERVFVSPAQHQIHHSRAAKHHDRNYGEIFAFWDWMFGTLYIPQGREFVEIGLADRSGNPLPQPHPTLRAALLVPFADSFRAVRGMLGRGGEKPSAGTEPA